MIHLSSLAAGQIDVPRLRAGSHSMHYRTQLCSSDGECLHVCECVSGTSTGVVVLLTSVAPVLLCAGMAQP
jgi:hypothetical protein